MIGVANDRQGRTEQNREQPEKNEGEMRRARQFLQQGAMREEERQASHSAEGEDPLMSNKRGNRSNRHFAKLILSVPWARRSRRCYYLLLKNVGKSRNAGSTVETPVERLSVKTGGRPATATERLSRAAWTASRFGWTCASSLQ